jgi:nicotinamidase-related amidase
MTKIKMSAFIIWCMVMLLLWQPVNAEEKAPQTPKTALLIIDIQYFYFPGGGYELVNPEAASLNAKKVLEAFRQKKKTIIHVRHNAKNAADIHANVKPLPGEKVISKNYANSFRETNLLKFLKENKIKRLVIVGMQTHMCVEAATRAAADYGFKCMVLHDACATRDLKFKDKTIPAEQVHYSTLSSLSGGYAKVIDTETFLKMF